MHGAIASIGGQQGQGSFQQAFTQEGIPHLGILQSKIQAPATSNAVSVHLTNLSAIVEISAWR